MVSLVPWLSARTEEEGLNIAERDTLAVQVCFFLLKSHIRAEM